MSTYATTDYKMVTLDAQPYLYNQRTCSMEPADISRAMGIAFQKVADVVVKNAITSAGKPLSVYYTHDEDEMTFRAGFFVSAKDATKAEGEVKADVLPAGEVLNYIHKGPYATLRLGYAEMMAFLQKTGRRVGAPTWEVYLNEPSDVASEEDLRTDIYVVVEDA